VIVTSIVVGRDWHQWEALVYLHRQQEHVPLSMWHCSMVTGASLLCIDVPVPHGVIRHAAAKRDVEYWICESVLRKTCDSDLQKCWICVNIIKSTSTTRCRRQSVFDVKRTNRQFLLFNPAVFRPFFRNRGIAFARA
jgi:hypothetical protein